jgi:hypothetical protein
MAALSTSLGLSLVADGFKYTDIRLNHFTFPLASSRLNQHLGIGAPSGS